MDHKLKEAKYRFNAAELQTMIEDLQEMANVFDGAMIERNALTSSIDSLEEALDWLTTANTRHQINVRSPGELVAVKVYENASETL